MVRFRILFLFFIYSQSYGQAHPNKSIDSLLTIGIESILLQNYVEADESFILLDKKYNDLPLGNIYLAAVEIAKSVDYSEELNEAYIDSLLDLAKDKTEILLDKDSDNLWYNYYDALIYGYKAYYYSISGNLISAFADGILSLRSFQKCLEIDNNFYEAYIAIGAYNYWKSAQSEAFLWLPFVEDNREKGIEYLEKALKADSYNKHLAEYSLVWIYIDYEEPEKAVQLATNSINEYKNSRFFMWGLARAYTDIDKQKAILVYSDLLKSVETIKERNMFNDIVLKHKIAMLSEETGNFSEALKLCNEILDIDIKSDKIRIKAEDRLNRVVKLKNKLNSLGIK
ncbi:MAG: hypothetical protein OQJ81_02685 [Melioribacteraceae bacterium]|nr:hypothetical protein [Melioribacteraceae bacterium]